MKQIIKFINRTAIVLAIFTLAVFSTSCKKDQSSNPSNGTYEVSFDINSVTQQSGFKSTLDINCSTLQADYATYKIDGGNFVTIPIFYVGNIPYTNSIKLSAGTHILNEFIVYSDNNTPNILTDDIVLSAAPHAGSVYGQIITSPLDYSFSVSTDKKNEIKLDVVCYESSTYDNFGFVYFKLNELIVHEQWFFGDFCIKEKGDYTNSHYALQPGWIGSGYGDVPAIFKVEVWRGGILQSTFTNDDLAHEYGNKVAIEYVDYKNQTDIFNFKLFILVKQGTQFNFVLFKEWTFNDFSNITEGSDGVVDFVLGNCYDPNSPPDYIFAPYMNLPLTVTYQITANPSVLGGYVDATLGSFTGGNVYDINPGVYASNCGDHNVTIGGGLYYMDVYSSLYPEKLPLFAQGTKWSKINWLYNHLDWYPGYHWYDVQGAIWKFDVPVWNGQAFSGVPAQTAIGAQMVADMNTYGGSYKVVPGGWAAIIFIPTGTLPNATNATVQTMFVKVDP